MGTSESKPLPKTPWRKLETTGLEERLRKDIDKVDSKMIANALLLGHVGAGKSSLINSCLSVSKERNVALAPTGDAEKSFTLETNNYKDKNLLKNVRLRDCMGITPEDGKGFNTDDIVYLLKGNIRNGYTFKSNETITSESPFYRKKPKFQHEAHCVVFVIDIRTMYKPIEEEELKKIKLLQEKIKPIPRVLVLTQVDKLGREVNASNIFSSVAVEKAMKTASKVLSINMASIHPVINYQEDIEPSSDKSILILLALRHIIQYACDRIEHVLENTESDSEEENAP